MVSPCQDVKPFCVLLHQDDGGGGGDNCNSETRANHSHLAPTTPAYQHSDFYTPDVLPVNTAKAMKTKLNTQIHALRIYTLMPSKSYFHLIVSEGWAAKWHTSFPSRFVLYSEYKTMMFGKRRSLGFPCLGWSPVVALPWCGGWALPVAGFSVPAEYNIRPVLWHCWLGNRSCVFVFGWWWLDWSFARFRVLLCINAYSWSNNIQWGLPFWYRLNQVVPDNLKYWPLCKDVYII